MYCTRLIVSMCFKVCLGSLSGLGQCLANRCLNKLCGSHVVDAMVWILCCGSHNVEHNFKQACFTHTSTNRYMNKCCGTQVVDAMMWILCCRRHNVEDTLKQTCFKRTFANRYLNNVVERKLCML